MTGEFRRVGRSGRRSGGALLLLNSLTVGGSETKIVAIANALHRVGAPVHIAYLNGPDPLRARIDPAIPVIPLHRKGKFSPGSVIRLAKYTVSREVGRIVTVNLHPLIYAHLAARIVATKPAVIALVNTTVHRSARDRAFMRIYAPLLRHSTRVVFGSESQAAAWVEAYRLNAGRCLSVFNGIDTDHFAPWCDPAREQSMRRDLGFHAGDFVLGTVGAMRPEKGHADLIMAACELRRCGLAAHVLLVGDGPCRGQLERYAQQCGVAEITRFVGPVEDVRPLLAAMDVFVLPSVAVETFSNAALEAMAMAKPVVLSDIGGAREMIADGTSGLIFPAGDVEALARSLRTLESNPAYRDCLGRQARARVCERFSFDRMFRDYEQWVFEDREIPAMAVT